MEKFFGRCWHEWKEREGYNPYIRNSWNGKQCIKCETKTAYNPPDGALEDYTTDYRAMGELIEAVRTQGHDICLSAEPGFGWCCDIDDFINNYADTLPLAVCMAVDKMLGE